MNSNQMHVLCEKLTTSVEPFIGKSASHIVRQLMFSLHPELSGCNDTKYTYIFMRAAALAKSAIEINEIGVSIDEEEIFSTITNELIKVH